MTEHSGQPLSPADAIRKTLTEQQSVIQTHESAIRQLHTLQTETNQRLADLTTFLQNSLPQIPATAPAPSPAPAPAPSVQPVFSDVRLPGPERFSDGTISLTEGVDDVISHTGLGLAHQRQVLRSGLPVLRRLSVAQFCLPLDFLDWKTRRFSLLADPEPTCLPSSAHTPHPNPQRDRTLDPAATRR
ncbi:uncharacterized protein LOC129379676 isoform X2 [Poeciliopsis prolifica]|uniref:uncharacterized protein LOC129379676 isoform X2 n=1 Tax=Poeciliopsis prolifica TaxID=188132 RepID=UPI00241425EF|nr:uncharacterized protein LOC129379676 isoform X2 [Poeciliopsis prolifica]